MVELTEGDVELTQIKDVHLNQITEEEGVILWVLKRLFHSMN